MTTKFRVETVMTTSIHLRIKAPEPKRNTQTHDIIPQTFQKCKTFLKKSLQNFKRFLRGVRPAIPFSADLRGDAFFAKDLRSFFQNDLTKRAVYGIILMFGFSPIWGH